MIRKQGGFMRNAEEEETAIVPLEEEEGGPRRVSRFKAARLARG
jgi:unconventional prefoldin RPB5 interactor 1